MPLYEYECEHCGSRFEQIQKFSDPPVEKCPKCGGGPVHKLMSSPAFQFKGTGWYVTDYAKKGTEPKSDTAEKPAAADAKSDAKTDTKPDAKSDTKTATKTETKTETKA